MAPTTQEKPNELFEGMCAIPLFQINVSRDLSAPVFLTTNNNRRLFFYAIRQLQNTEHFEPGINAQLLAEQMLMTQIMLLENWTAGVIDLERFRLTSKYHFLLLIKAWAKPELSNKLTQQILDIQNGIETLDAQKRTSPKKTKIVKEILSHENQSVQKAES